MDDEYIVSRACDLKKKRKTLLAGHVILGALMKKNMAEREEEDGNN